jgi:hypothetical protein
MSSATIIFLAGVLCLAARERTLGILCWVIALAVLA